MPPGCTCLLVALTRPEHGRFQGRHEALQTAQVGVPRAHLRKLGGGHPQRAQQLHAVHLQGQRCTKQQHSGHGGGQQAAWQAFCAERATLRRFKPCFSKPTFASRPVSQSLHSLCTLSLKSTPSHLHLVLPGHQVEGGREEDWPPKVHARLLRRRQRPDKALLVGRQRGTHALVVPRAAKLLVAQWGWGQQLPVVWSVTVGSVERTVGSQWGFHGMLAEPAKPSRGQRHAVPQLLPGPAHATSPPTWMQRSRAVARLVTPSTFCIAALALRYTWHQTSMRGCAKCAAFDE